MNTILFIIYLILTISGLIFVKLGGSECSFLYSDGNFDFILNIKFILGIVMYGLSFITWMYLISVGNLSILLPISVAVTNVFVLLISSKLFDTVITPYHWLGVITIVIGIVLITFGSKS